MASQNLPRHAAASPADSAATKLLALVVGSWPTQAIAVAARLGIADLLADGPRSCGELAAATHSHEGALYRLLRALASLGIFAEQGSGRFVLTPLADHLRSDAPISLRDYAILMSEEWHWRAWGNLLHSVRTGEPSFEHVTGMPVFDYFAKHPEAAQAFEAAMTSRSSQENEAISAAYDFPAGTVVDVGGGHGSLLACILRQNAAACGVLFDLTQVLARAAPALRAAGVEQRIRLQDGDFFDSVPAGGDVYLMKKIVHDWDDARAGRILANCRAAMSRESRLLLVEQVILPGNGPALGKLFDLQMLALTPGGRERTEAEYRRLLAGAGLELARIIPTDCPLDIIEAVPG